MDEQQARLILQAYRPAVDRNDPEVAAALQEAARNPELAGWFAEEQAFDRAIAAHLEVSLVVRPGGGIAGAGVPLWIVRLKRRLRPRTIRPLRPFPHGPLVPVDQRC